MLIDTGLVPIASIQQELWIVKDFASDLLVLRLASAETAIKIMSVPRVEKESCLATLLSLYFMRVHLYAVNARGLNAKQRVILLWSSMLFIMQVDGIHKTTKRNWAVECI